MAALGKSPVVAGVQRIHRQYTSLGTTTSAASVPRSLDVLTERPNARVRLLCFPWASGDAPQDYRDLEMDKLLPDFIEVVAFRWSGRGARSKEPQWTDFGWIPGEMAAIADFLAEKPFAVFGHSMGSSAVYECARWFTQNTSLRPVHMFVSGTVPPQEHIHLPTLSLDGLSRDAQCQKLAYFSASKISVLTANDYQEFKAIFPTMSADLNLCDAYRPVLVKRAEPLPTLTCDITGFVGTKDMLNRDKMSGWAEVTTGAWSLTRLPGRHFYLKERGNANMPALAAAIAHKLSDPAAISKL